MDIKYLSPLLLAYEDRMKEKDELIASLQVGWQTSRKDKVCKREDQFKPGGNILKTGIPTSWQVLKCLLQEGKKEGGSGAVLGWGDGSGWDGSGEAGGVAARAGGLGRIDGRVCRDGEPLHWKP